MRIEDDASLRDYNTLRLPARARHFARVRSVEELREGVAFCDRRGLPLLILGSGSNLVLRDCFDGCVLKMEIAGEELVRDGADAVELRVAAGVNWHSLVLSTHARGWHGLENLALIPGTVGAAPIQNIGAYGIEIRDFITSVSVLDRTTGEIRELGNAECGFGYRSSRFQSEPSLLVTALTVRLPRGKAPHTGYAALREELREVVTPTPRDVLRAVIAIRERRLPDPARLPNAGSFFKNPVVDAAQFAALRERHPGIVHWTQQGSVKLAAAWLVDQCGWRGYRGANVGMHSQQALVLINHGAAHAEEILDLAARVAASVMDRFGVELEIEPGIR